MARTTPTDRPAPIRRREVAQCLSEYVLEIRNRRGGENLTHARHAVVLDGVLYGKEAEPPDKEIHLQGNDRAHPRRVQDSSFTVKVDAHASAVDLKADQQGAAERQQKAVSPRAFEKVSPGQ